LDGDRLIVLDTHAWIWWVGAPDRLSEAARRRIELSAAVGICAISCWEVAMLVAKGRLGLDRDVLEWLRQALRQPGTRLLPLRPEVAVAAARMNGAVPSDPADRMIVATAMFAGAALVTRDRALQAMDGLETVW
jgi:PIN domain nuclease of toxin-antitoxin system